MFDHWSAILDIAGKLDRAAKDKLGAARQNHFKLMDKIDKEIAAEAKHPKPRVKATKKEKK